MSWRRREIKDDTVETGTPEETIHQKKRPQPKWDDLFDHSRTQWTHRSRVHWWMDGAGAGLFLFLFFFHLSLSVSFLCFDEGHRYYGDGFFFFLFFFLAGPLGVKSTTRPHFIGRMSPAKSTPVTGRRFTSPEGAHRPLLWYYHHYPYSYSYYYYYSHFFIPVSR